MPPIIKAYYDTRVHDTRVHDTLAHDTVYLEVTDHVGTEQWYHGHDGQFTLMARPDPDHVVSVVSHYTAFYQGTQPAKFLPGTVFILNAADSAGNVVLEVHERKKHGIAPLYGAPRRTLLEVAKLTWPFTIPLTRKFSDDALVPGAQLMSDRSMTPAIVLEVRPRGVAVMLPGYAVPYNAPFFAATFTTPASASALGVTWTRETTDLAPLPQGNCDLLLPGAVTDQGVVINISSTYIVLENQETNGRESITVYVDPNNPGRVFTDATIIPVVITPAVPLPSSRYGELWRSWTGDFLGYNSRFQVSRITDDLLSQFWGGNQVPPLHRATMSYLHTDGLYYPCASTLAMLPKTRVALEECWYVGNDADGHAVIQTFSCSQFARNWSGLPVAKFLFTGPDDQYNDTPWPARQAAMFACELCNTEGQDRNHSEVAYSYPSSTSALRTPRRVGPCCLGRPRPRAPLCPTCNTHFYVAEETRTRNTIHCPACTISGAVAAYFSYSYKPAPKFFGTGPLFFGVELELKTVSNQAMKSLANMVADSPARDLVYAKTDSSIGDYGLEFVTHPFSLEHVQADPQLLGALLGYINDADDDWTAASSCGIHIHTSKKGYSVLRSSIPGDGADKLTEEQLLTRGIFRAQKFVYGNPKLITHFAGRDSSRYASLAIKPGCDQHDARITGAREALRLCREHGSSKALRYSAMNFTKDTIEYRVFKSTTYIAELMRNIYFIDSIVQYARHHAMPKTKAPDLAPYREFLETKPYYESVRTHFDAWTGAKKAKPIPGIAPGRSDMEFMGERLPQPLVGQWILAHSLVP